MSETLPGNDHYAVKRGEFGWALEHMKLGHAVRRKAWDEGRYVAIARVMTTNEPLVVSRDTDGIIASWYVSENDILANDWEAVTA